MSKHFHSLKISKVVKETQDAISIAFEIPQELKEVFSFKAGQALVLKVKINNEEQRRTYSICTGLDNGEPITVATKRVKDGLVSNYLNDHAKAGDSIEVMPPSGSFFVTPDKENIMHYVLIGGGSGITPLMSILKTVLLQEPKSKVTLIYGNRNIQSIIFKKKLDGLKNNYSERFQLIYTLDQPEADWQGFKGMLSQENLTNILQDNLSTDIKNAVYYLCGPTEMMKIAEKTLLNLSVFPGNIHHEYFTPSGNKKEEIVETKTETKVIEEEIVSEKIESVTVILDQEEHIVPINPSLKILHAAMEAGLEPPYSCRSGICSTCRAKLLSGRVKMDEREGLTEDEIKMGYILTCQSHPLTANVKVDYE